MQYLGIDFGLRRVGLACSEGDLAAPLKIIKVKGLIDAAGKISEFVKKEKVDKVIVGLPEGKMGQTVLGFVKALRKKGLDVDTADETLSSQKATSWMIESNVPKKGRRINDAYSAAIILQQFLDSRREK